MGATLGLIAGGILKGWGDARQQEAADARALALEDLRERRREAEIQQKRVWEVEDRNAGDDREDKRAEQHTTATIAAEDRRDKRDGIRQDRIDERTDKQIAAADDRASRAAAARDAADGNKPKSPGQIIAPILDKIAKSGKKSLSAGELEALDTYQKVTAEQRYKNSIYDGMDGGTDGEPPDAASSVGPAGTSAPASAPQPPASTLAPPPTTPAVKQAVSTPSAEAPPRIVPQRYIDLLKQNPDRAGEFDAKFGAGSSKRYLGQ